MVHGTASPLLPPLLTSVLGRVGVAEGAHGRRVQFKGNLVGGRSIGGREEGRLRAAQQGHGVTHARLRGHVRRVSRHRHPCGAMREWGQQAWRVRGWGCEHAAMRVIARVDRVEARRGVLREGVVGRVGLEGKGGSARYAELLLDALVAGMREPGRDVGMRGLHESAGLGGLDGNGGGRRAVAGGLERRLQRQQRGRGE